MRDTHRMREKYDLSLDSRQVVSLLIGAIVVLGAVFVLGVLVGKKLAGTQHADRGSDLLAALDHRTDALEKARAAPTLTFQEELTRTTPDDKHLAAPAKAPPAKPVTPPALATTAAAKAPPPPVASATVAAVKPPPAPAASSPSKPAATTVAAAPKPAAGTSGNMDATSPDTATETVATRATPAAAKPATPKPPEATASNGAFTLQLGASPNREDAERQASRLREKGYAPYIVTAEVPGKGTWYRVRMGSFPTKDAASRYLQDFKRETQAEAFVASTK